MLVGKGSVSHQQAIEKAEKEFEIYRKREMKLMESDFDKEMKKLTASEKDFFYSEKGPKSHSPSEKGSKSHEKRGKAGNFR